MPSGICSSELSLVFRSAGGRESVAFPTHLMHFFNKHGKKRITMAEIKAHPWFLKNLPLELSDGYQERLQGADVAATWQSVEEINSIIEEAKTPVEGPKIGHLIGGSDDLSDLDADVDLDEVDSSGEFVCAL